MAWWIGPNSASDVTNKCLDNAGFVCNELDIGMVCDLIQVVDNYRFPERLVIRKCTTPRDYAGFGEVLASIFDPPDECVKVFYNKMATMNPSDIKNMILFVGYEDDSPITTSCLFLTDVSGIYDIATRPEKRKLGYGSAMFYRALIESKKMGLKKSVLQASPDGFNLYKKFGFKEICEFNVWNNLIK